ncbi:unannotated protein [freshwater metagenome]|uniref:Unannotated protein n=1 Tax=freshwater metagenome TaxID=449393 RepID=A0A6J7D0C3_9ZZZZ|nr:hypothetical protein [Actinomycetota bacterium]
MGRTSVATLCAFALVLVALVGPAAAAPTVPGAVGKATGQIPAQVLAYWTPARKAAAKPRALAKSGGGGSTTSAYTITQVGNTERLGFPGRTNGKVYMTFGKSNYVCSGTAVASVNGSTVLTAGHCVWDAASGYATNFVFVPAKSGSSEPYGAWAATAVYTTQAWHDSEDFSFDNGAAKVATNGGTTLTGTLGGGRAITFSGARDQAYTLYGYPASGKYSGQYLYKCATRYAGDDPSISSDPKPIGVRCKWPGGSSGGAWIGVDGNVASVTSFGYASLSDWVFGPYLGAVAQAFYTDVQDN